MFLFLFPAGIVPFNLDSRCTRTILGNKIVVGGYIEDRFFYNDGTARLTAPADVVAEHFTAGTVYTKKGEIIVVGEHFYDLSGSAALGMYGYAGMAHQLFLAGGQHHDAIIPRHFIEECLAYHPQAWKQCPPPNTTVILPALPRRP